LDIDGSGGAPDTRERDAEAVQARVGRSAVTEHIFMIGALIFIAATTLIVGYLAYRVHRKSDQIEGIVAAVYLQAPRVLEQYRP
jgi:hypothetical protein